MNRTDIDSQRRSALSLRVRRDLGALYFTSAVDVLARFSVKI